ncbi:efflux RND transporter periplasmic adaptor subunit [Methylobacterium sp. WL12]|uniref:efflux RND transporter periplasmic adaptor subunit n=1 Tax=Methylobacterium sp. WL12 TaxID=2603890 RepID=UPI0011CB525C|nr:efflux RND transporter periplasmic adaptor subunit [Methylobacterium sp. WL12]TXM72904.1 efflux RND transporter periplasmic adaptor subunit [Methylobacterium sp. WL12]
MRRASLGFGVFLVALSACNQKQASAPVPLPPPEVGIVTVAPQAIPYVRDLPGRVAPMRIAEVRSRVSGLVVRRLFEQGSQVKEGDVLYKIDPAPYQVDLMSAEAALARQEAALVLANQQAERLETLLTRQSASQAQFDTAFAGKKQAEAEVAGARATRDRAKLNLDWTDVRAPISGRIGRALLTEGTLIESGTTGVLATIQQLDPIYVDITQSVGELNKLRRDLASGELSRLERDSANVHLIMDDGALYPMAGQLLFSDVTADPSTGQVTLRVQIPNPHDELFPGMYVRARIKQGIDSDAIAVPQQAIQRTNDGKAEVWVVKEDDRVALQPVEVGPVVGTNWLIRDGLKAGERVVTEGFQKIVAGQQVKPVDKTPPHPTAEAMPHDVDEVAEAEAKLAEAKMKEAKAAEARAAEAKASAAKASATKASDGKASNGKASNGKASDGKASDGKAEAAAKPR